MNQPVISRQAFVRSAGAVAAVAGAGMLGATVARAEEAATEEPAADAPADAAPASGITAADYEGKWAFEIAPEPITDIAETVEAELVVVGAGYAGMATATSAQQSGVQTVLVSASSMVTCRGGSNNATYSRVMEAAGIGRDDFDIENVYQEEIVSACGNRVDSTKWSRYANSSEEAMNWVIDIARADEVQVFLERDNIMDGGPDYAIGFGAKGDDSGSASTGQQNAVEAVEKFALDHGATIIYDTVAKQLVRDEESGRVTAVVAQKADGSYVKFVANKGIVLATGDFSANKEMLAKYCPQVLPLVGIEQEAEPDYNRGFALTGLYPGDGQKMGLWIGAAWQHTSTAPMMQGSWGGSTEPLGFHMGLNVNTKTERYQREDISSPYSANYLLSQPGHRAYGIWTANYAQDVIDNGHEWYFFGSKYEVPAATADEMIATWDAGAESGSYFKADTLDDLAAQLGLDAAKLAEVVARYNELCDLGEDLDFHKDPSYLIKIDENGPFYAAQNTAMMMTVMGGLNTNCNMQVCDENDEPIPGLFNVGHMTGNMYANNYNFAIPGNCYGINCITYGYLLGRDLANGVFDA